MKYYLILMVLAFAAGPCLAQNAADPAPATQPAAWQVPGRPLPPGYRVLLTKSIFGRNGEAAAAQGAAFPLENPGGPVASGDATFTLRGVVREQGIYTAIVEDPTNHQIQQIAEGCALAGGHVTGITLRGFRYEAGGIQTVVAIGHDLHGALAAPIAPPAAAPKQAVAGAPPAPDATPDPKASAPAPTAEPGPDQNFASADDGAVANTARGRRRARRVAD